MRDVGFGTVHFVSGNYFDTLGVRAAIGRTLTPDDDTPATTAAVLSDPFWRRSFGGRTDILERTVDLNGKAFAIVGVMPRGFFGVDPSTIPDVIVPAGAVQLAASFPSSPTPPQPPPPPSAHCAPKGAGGAQRPARIVPVLAEGRRHAEPVVVAPHASRHPSTRYRRSTSEGARTVRPSERRTAK